MLYLKFNFKTHNISEHSSFVEFSPYLLEILKNLGIIFSQTKFMQRSVIVDKICLYSCMRKRGICAFYSFRQA